MRLWLHACLVWLSILSSVFGLPGWRLSNPEASHPRISTQRISSRAAAPYTSNNRNYNADQVRADLLEMMDWAYDTGNLSGDDLNETVAAIMSAASRYFPEVPTRAMCRVIIADIKTESDFKTSLISGGRLDSGSSWGLLQVSPGGGSQELSLFKQHVVTSANKFSWSAKPGSAGPLIDWDTGAELNAASLTNDDLFRPWVNIHVATWIQSNSARTSSQDPYEWSDVASSATQVLKSQKLDDRASTDSTKKAVTVAKKALKLALQGSGLARSVRTGLGTWVAGAATDGFGSFMQSGDDISQQYLATISKAVSHLYGHKIAVSWMDGLQVNAGLVDYQ